MKIYKVVIVPDDDEEYGQQLIRVVITFKAENKRAANVIADGTAPSQMFSASHVESLEEVGTHHPMGHSEFLGKRVRVKLDTTAVTEGVFLGYNESGELETLEDDGMVHYSWPLLTIEPIGGELWFPTFSIVTLCLSFRHPRNGGGYVSYSVSHRKSWERS